MAKISESKGRPDENSGYARLFGSQQLGHLMSRVHAAVIRSGNELEKTIEAETPETIKTPLDAILGQTRLFHTEYEVAFQARMPGIEGHPGGTIDIAIFDHSNHKTWVIELKDGDTFDTKKSSGELESMTKFAAWIAQKTGYSATFYFCCFNQDDKYAIVRGAKGRFDVSHAMTGRELCDLLHIDYDELRQKRKSQQSENLKYYLAELLKINEVRQHIRDLLNRS